MTFRLPHKFQQLEKWSTWSLATETARYQRRAESTLDEVKAFVADLKPHMEDIIQYLSQFEWGASLAEEDANLFHIGLAFMEASIPVDLNWKESLAVDSFPLDRVTVPER